MLYQTKRVYSIVVVRTSTIRERYQTVYVPWSYTMFRTAVVELSKFQKTGTAGPVAVYHRENPWLVISALSNTECLASPTPTPPSPAYSTDTVPAFKGILVHRYGYRMWLNYYGTGTYC